MQGGAQRAIALLPLILSLSVCFCFSSVSLCQWWCLSALCVMSVCAFSVSLALYVVSKKVNSRNCTCVQELKRTFGAQPWWGETNVPFSIFRHPFY